MDMGAGQPNAGVVKGRHRSMSLCREDARTGSARCSTMLAPTAATPDTGSTERLQLNSEELNYGSWGKYWGNYVVNIGHNVLYFNNI